MPCGNISTEHAEYDEVLPAARAVYGELHWPR